MRNYILTGLIVITVLIGYSIQKPGAFLAGNKSMVAPDTTIFPFTDSNYVVKLLVPGDFKKAEINYDANTFHWFALLSNGVSFYIRKFQPEHKIIKNEGGEEVHQISGHDSLNTLLMMSGVELIEKEVVKMQIGRKTLGAGDRMEFNYNGKKFVFIVEGDEKKDKTTKKNYIANYKLYIAQLKKEKGKTLLVSHKRIDDSFPEIVFIGDMDNDKKPDIIINNICNKAENHLTLFLSNNPPKGSLYKVMGVFNYSGK